MKTLSRIQKLANTKQAKQAFVELGCLLLFADNKSTLAEQDMLDQVLALQTEPNDRLQDHYQMTMSRLNSKKVSREALMKEAATKLDTPELKMLAIDFAREIAIGDNRASDSENQMINTLERLLKSA